MKIAESVGTMSKTIELESDNSKQVESFSVQSESLPVQTTALSILHMSVRDFVAFVYRRGGLGSNSFFSILNGLGIKTHQQFFKAFKKSQPESTIYIEYPLNSTNTIQPVIFDIQGRADIIVLSPDDQMQIIEIKTFSKADASFPSSANFLHVAQARIYAYMFCLEKQRMDSIIQITIKYILTQTFQIKDFNETVSFNDLEKFFNETCSHYIKQGISIHNYETLRDVSIKNLTFPYTDLRQGQKEFMNTVLASIKKREPLFVQAPTGIGKTISTLYPAIKSIPKNYFDFIFYLTAKNSTQDVAKKTIDDMRSRGLVLKSIQITAKEKICLCKELYCDTTTCPYAVNYYEQYSDAINELTSCFSIDAAILQQLGEKYEVCPFELGLDASLFCDVIICDYNYIFDPKVQLERFVKQEAYRFTILVDEAHNLPDRANEMYSAAFSYQDLIETVNFKIYFSPLLKEALSKISLYFETMFAFLSSENEVESSFDSSILSKEMFKSPSFCATRKMPKEFLKILEVFIQYAKEEMDKLMDPQAKKALTNLFFSAKFFGRVSEEFFNDSYITTFTKEYKNSQINFRCMDSSNQLAKFHEGKHSTIFFSATLSPVQYFESKFCDSKASESIKKLILPSPFPKENLLVGIVPGISTKYNNRRDSVSMIAEVIYSAISSKVGNYIVYSPSFEYQQWIVYAFEMIMESENRKNPGPAISGTTKNANNKIKIRYDSSDDQISKVAINTNNKIIKQVPGMNEKNQKAFLKEFEIFGSRTLIAFAVMGGVFGEGIDLAGETLSGVILVGVGLPRKSPERDIMMDYYSSCLGNGYDFAYRYPGFNKILQAAGRVIRSEYDRGFILLLDERYQTPEYQALFPEEWDFVVFKSKTQIRQSLKEFLNE